MKIIKEVAGFETYAMENSEEEIIFYDEDVYEYKLASNSYTTLKNTLKNTFFIESIVHTESGVTTSPEEIGFDEEVTKTIKVELLAFYKNSLTVSLGGECYTLEIAKKEVDDIELPF